jgi:hypothetical protein
MYGFNCKRLWLTFSKTPIGYLTMNETLILKAIKKFPKAKRIAVENFTMGTDRLDMETSMNLSADTKCYKWNSDTVNAIRYVLKHKLTN